MGSPDANGARGGLATRLPASAHGTVGLINRCVAAGLVSNQRSEGDARQVEVHLTARARALVERIASSSTRSCNFCTKCSG